jgi:hypothetical protein
MGGGGSSSANMPRLDAFDEEFGREPAAVLPARERTGSPRFLARLLLAAAIIGLPVWAWLSANGHSASDGRSGPPALQAAAPEESGGQVDRLLSQVAALQQVIRDLTRAQQEASDSIAALKAAEQDSRNVTPGYWYSDPAALSFGTGSPPRAVAAPSVPRRSATARSENRRRENGAPLSLGAPQPTPE